MIAILRTHIVLTRARALHATHLFETGQKGKFGKSLNALALPESRKNSGSAPSTQAKYTKYFLLYASLLLLLSFGT
jgi:hypothetical protein